MPWKCRCKINQCPHNQCMIEKHAINRGNDKTIDIILKTQLLEQDFHIQSTNWKIAYEVPCKNT